MKGATLTAADTSVTLLPSAAKHKSQIPGLALTISKNLLVVAVIGIAYAQRDRQKIAERDEKMGQGSGGCSASYAFWFGVTVTSSLGLLGGLWFWVLFRATLEYDTGFPATTPRRRRN